jgi:hypothetical protein
VEPLLAQGLCATCEEAGTEMKQDASAQAGIGLLGVAVLMSSRMGFFR